MTTIQAGTLWLGADAQTPIFSLGGVNLQGGSLVLSYSGTSPAAAVESALAAAHRHDFAAGSAQIFSSTAATDGLTLGWSDNGNGTVIIMATLPGDAFLDGAVDVNDLTVVLTHFGVTGAVWSQGDFTYDGRVDINDLTIVLANFGQSLGSPARRIGRRARAVRARAAGPCHRPAVPVDPRPTAGRLTDRRLSLAHRAFGSGARRAG